MKVTFHFNKYTNPVLQSNRMKLIETITHLFPSNAQIGQLGSLEQVAYLAQCMGLPLYNIRRNETSRNRALIFTYCCIIMLSTNGFYIYFELKHLLVTWPNLDAFTHNMCFSISHWAGFIKIINIFWHLPTLSNIIEKLKATIQRYVRSKEQYFAFERSEQEIKTILMIYVGVIGFTGVMGIFLLFLFPYGIIEERFPYCVILPDIVKTTFPHKLQLLYIGMNCLIIAEQVVVADFINILLIIQIRTQLDVLMLSFENININAQFNYIHDHYANRSPAFESLRSIIQHHCLLMEIRNEVQNIYSMSVLLQFVTSLLVFAITGFRATVATDQDMTKDAMVFLYCGCIFLQLSLYCWFGNDVFEKSNALARQGFGTVWFECDQQFKSAFLLFLMNAQKPFIFSGAGFVALLLPTFTSILGKSYSSIAVLRQAYNE